MASDRQAGTARHLARPDVGDAVDLGQAVATVPGQAQRPAAARRVACPEDGNRDGVALPERDGLTVDDDPARLR